MELVSEKWGGHPHYRGLVHVLGEDEHGSWVWGPAGRTIYRGDQALFATEHPAVTVVVPGAWWALTWWPGHESMELYVNINTPAVWEADRIVATDVDLDVVRWHDGRVEVVDRDEFELHQVQYRYPPALIGDAERATAAAYELAVARLPPFDGAAARVWTERAQAMALEPNA